MNIKIKKEAQACITLLEAEGFEAWVVGGCVRDSLRNIAPVDWDICTNALPEETIACVKAAGLQCIETGLQHGTVTAMVDHEPYEITTYRVDGAYVDNRRPEQVTFVRNILEDLARRDFTINAMAYHPTRGLLDPFGGQKDLKKGLIRCVGDPALRFDEDALRIMRALRFSAVLGFQIEEETKKNIFAKRDLLGNISPERLREELIKLLCGANVGEILLTYVSILGVFLPELSPMVGCWQKNPYHVYDVWGHTVKTVVSIKKEPVLRLTMLFHDIGKPSSFTEDENGIGHFYGHGAVSAVMTEKLMRRLCFDRNTIDRVCLLVFHHNGEARPVAKQVRRWIGKIGVEALLQLIEVKEADECGKVQSLVEGRYRNLNNLRSLIGEMLEKESCFHSKDLAVSGEDLLKMGMESGPKIGQLLTALLEEVIEERLLNEKEDLSSFAKAWILEN